MTEEDERQIVRLRHKGLDYKPIALVLGLPLKAVTEYCEANGLEVKEAKKKPGLGYQFRCEHCGRIFYEVRNRPRRFCGRECYILERYWTERPKGETPRIKRRKDVRGLKGGVEEV